MGVKAKHSETTKISSLAISLSDPGMTPLLRCGLGGLAASLRAALLESAPKAKWPAAVSLGGAEYLVEPRRITVNFNGVPPEKALEKLFKHAFRLTRQGIIDLPGTYDAGASPSTELRAIQQQALKKTFLQHGKTTMKAGTPKAVSVEIDEQPVPVAVQPYSRFTHQGSWEVVAKGLSKPVELAGWAYPGATQRHVAFGNTKYEYGAATALCALFALVGSVSLDAPQAAPGGAGVLVVLEPADLVRFAEVRPRLSPQKVPDVHVGGAGDAVLQVEVALRAEKTEKMGRRAVAGTHAMLLKAAPWASQQKSRSATVSVDRVDDHLLALYSRLLADLPTKLRPFKAKGKGKGEEAVGYFAITSALRAFVADNLARGRRWFSGFATATTGEKQPRYVHYYWEREGLGALRFEERKGLISMTEDLDAAEEILVSSVQQALRQRFGRIWDETKGMSPQGRSNRMDAERERLRLAFAGAKTPEQIRGALADLWSRAGTVRQLQDGWKQVLPLLRTERWQTARDLALVALASYQREAGGDKQEDVAAASADDRNAKETT